MTNALAFVRFLVVQVLKETCSLFRHLILDDDVRVEFSKAHDHARTIAADVLVNLTHLIPGIIDGDRSEIIHHCYFNCSDSHLFFFLFIFNRTVYMKDKNVLGELLLTIAALTVRHEFCAQVQEAGGLKFISDSMVKWLLRNLIFSKFTKNICVFRINEPKLEIERTLELDACIQRIAEAVTCIGWR